MWQGGDDLISQLTSPYLSLYLYKAVNLHMPIQNFIEMITTHSQFEVAMTIEHESKDENLSAKAGVIELIYSLMRLDPIKGCNPNHLTLLSLYFTGQQTPEDLSLQRVFNLYESRVGISTSTYLLNRKVKSASDSEKLLDIVNGDIFGVLDIANMQTSVEMFDINVGLQDLDKPSSNTNNNTYSPQFLLPLTAHALELDFENKLDLRVMVESNVIGLAVMALSSVKSDMRKMGYFVLDKFFPKLRVNSTNEFLWKDFSFFKF